MAAVMPAMPPPTTSIVWLVGAFVAALAAMESPSLVVRRSAGGAWHEKASSFIRAC
jgi:hypothetical protein